MLEMIRPKGHPSPHARYRSRIDLLMGIIKYSQDLPLTGEEQQATFVLGLAEDTEDKYLHKGDLYGGALIYQRSAAHLPFSFKGLLASPSQENIWSGAISFFINPLNRKSLTTPPEVKRRQLDSDDGFHLFYTALLEKFMEFGHENHIDFLYLTLPPREYHNTKTKGNWSYAIEISPEESPDGLFHGILSLVKTSKLSKKKKLLSPLRSVKKAA